MTKTEIINRFGVRQMPMKYILEAMDEYAKEVAVGFAGWMGQNNVKEASSFGDVWYIGIFYEKTYTTEQLFNQYLQHLNQSK